MMEYAEGGSLWDMLSRTDDLPFARRMEVALDAARGLHYLHTNKPAVLHRDIKGCGSLCKCAVMFWALRRPLARFHVALLPCRTLHRCFCAIAAQAGAAGGAPGGRAAVLTLKIL